MMSVSILSSSEYVSYDTFDSCNVKLRVIEHKSGSVTSVSIYTSALIDRSSQATKFLLFLQPTTMDSLMVIQENYLEGK